jgi:hypothetical protein
MLTKPATLRRAGLPRGQAEAILIHMKQGISLLSAAALLVTVGAAVFAPRPLRADDLKLKDGTTISGTIVGFEEHSFKVKTSYGFAVVQKDQVVSIVVSDASKATAEKSPDSAEKPKPASVNDSAPPLPAMAGAATDSAADPAPVAKSGTPSASVSKPERVARAAPPAPAPAKVAKAAPPTPAPAVAPVAKAMLAAATPGSAASAPAAKADPPKPPAPDPIRESVNGNTYTNETYRFHMYKPPTWDVIATAPSVMPGAITAMGTGDDTTYLLIGQEPAGKSIATDMDTTERRLRDVMENFRPLDAKQITISGAAATEHTFRGSVDSHDWSGVVVLVPRGAKLYTIFGMTRADNDLVQIQENVIARAISSLQFTD